MPERTVQTQIQPSDLIPGGIKHDDHWHIGIDDGTCSRCRKPVPDNNVPLRLFSPDGNDQLVYCEPCCGVPPEVTAMRGCEFGDFE